MKLHHLVLLLSMFLNMLVFSGAARAGLAAPEAPIHQKDNIDGDSSVLEQKDSNPHVFGDF